MSAGEALPADLYRRWRERFGVEIIDGIGTTESGHIFLSNRPGRRAARVLRACPSPATSARSSTTRAGRCRRARSGISASAATRPWPTTGTSTTRRRTTLFGPWIQTGDKYHQDADGYFWYDGRGDDMLKVGGIWVSPIEVEATLIQHDAVLEAAVVGQEDADRLVKPRAYVVLKEPGRASEALAEELRAFVKDKIAPYKYPRWIEFVTELPKTATGKIQRFKLRQERPAG